MLQSILTKYQEKTFTKNIDYEGDPCIMSVTIRYDDRCGNGHNTFSITGSIKGRGIQTCRCIHEEIKKYFPEFAHLIKWHLCSSDEPLYYIENTLYHASNSKDARYKVGEPNEWAKVLKFNRSSGVRLLIKALSKVL